MTQKLIRPLRDPNLNCLTRREFVTGLLAADLLAACGGEDSVESDEEMAAAFSFSSLLRLPYLLDRLVPQLEAALDGDPGTQASPIS